MLHWIQKLSLVLISSLGLACTGVNAQTWPQRPIRIIVPYTVGGASDITARLLADRMTVKFGQAVTVENRAGASGSRPSSDDTLMSWPRPRARKCGSTACAP